MKNTCLLILLGTISIYSLGCPNSLERACTEIGCSNGYSLTLNHIGWAPGTYQFDIDIDGQKTTCNVTLPFPSCDIPKPCNSNKVSLGLSGCALPSSQHGISSVSTSEVDFAAMTLKISLGTTVLLEQALIPHFQTSQPNGPGCGPICRNASDTAQF